MHYFYCYLNSYVFKETVLLLTRTRRYLGDIYNLYVVFVATHKTPGKVYGRLKLKSDATDKRDFSFYLEI